MSDSLDELRKTIEELKKAVIVPATASGATPVEQAQKSVDEENSWYALDRHKADMADRLVARAQRKVYAKCVFILVCVWIAAIYALLIFQVFGSCMTPKFRPLSDTVLIALISSTTVNLIGTLIIVLKYIFRIPGPTSYPNTPTVSSID